MKFPRIADHIVSTTTVVRIKPPYRSWSDELEVKSIVVRTTLPAEVVEKANAEGPSLLDEVRAKLDEARRREAERDFLDAAMGTKIEQPWGETGKVDE